MTYREFERKLYSHLAGIDEKDKTAIIEYYEEIYLEKKELGIPESEIVDEFGPPEECAARMADGMAESDSMQTAPPREEKHGEENIATKNEKATESATRVSLAEILGMVLFTLILVIPLASVLLSIVVSLGAVALSGAIVAIAGVLYALISPLHFISGLTLLEVLMHLGIGLGLAGAGGVCFAILYPITKNSAILSYKLIKGIYIKKK